MKILCLVPTLLEDLDSDCLASIKRQTVSVDHIELVTQRVQGGTFPERVSYVLNKALEKFTLENYDFLLRVDGDTVLPKDFVEKGVAARCDLYGTIGYAMLIRVQPFLSCMNGRFFRWSNDAYIPHCFAIHGFSVLRGDFSKVRTRHRQHSSWMYYYVIGSNYYRFGYTILHFMASLKTKELRVSAMLLAGFLGSWINDKPKFDIAGAVQAFQINKLRFKLKKKTVSLRHWIVMKVARLLAPKLAATLEAKKDVRPMVAFLKQKFGSQILCGVEIGVHKGINAESILKTLKISKLFLVDPYLLYDSPGDPELAADRNFHYAEAKGRIQEYKDKVVWKLSFSVDAAKTLLDESLDFAYIDAKHDYLSVIADLEAYYRKVKVGGVLGGHDFSNVHSGVVRAVAEFASTLNLKLFVEQPDWWIVKEPTEI